MLLWCAVHTGAEGLNYSLSDWNVLSLMQLESFFLTLFFIWWLCVIWQIAFIVLKIIAKLWLTILVLSILNSTVLIYVEALKASLLEDLTVLIVLLRTQKLRSKLHPSVSTLQCSTLIVCCTAVFELTRGDNVLFQAPFLLLLLLLVFY